MHKYQQNLILAKFYTTCRERCVSDEANDDRIMYM